MARAFSQQQASELYAELRRAGSLGKPFQPLEPLALVLCQPDILGQGLVCAREVLFVARLAQRQQAFADLFVHVTGRREPVVDVVALDRTL